MVVIYSPNHYLHNPRFELFDGEKLSNAENPKRLKLILAELKRNRFKVQPFCKKVPIQLVKQIHDFDYVKYLQQLSANLGDRLKYPSVFPAVNRIEIRNSPNNLGFYSMDTYTPVSKFTFNAALDSASVAFEGAFRLQQAEDKVIYAVCRPPGHHASPNKMGGYCYFNNAAIAAQYLSDFGKVAILDIDFHHGNGTQEIFYQRNDILFVSIHADPREKFPYFSGYENEIGVGSGKGFNINRALTSGATNGQYQKVLENVLLHIRMFKPSYLIVSFGGDTYKKDPIGGFNLTQSYYRTMGKTIKRAINLPTLIVQEGGYHNHDLGKLVVNLLRGFSI